MPRGCGVACWGCCWAVLHCCVVAVGAVVRAGAIAVSRAASLGDLVSRAFHARLARPSPKRLWPRTRARTGLRRPARRLARRPTGRHPSTSSATHHAAELRHTRYLHEHSLDTEAELTSCANPYHLDRLLRCGAVIPEQRSEHGPRQR